MSFWAKEVYLLSLAILQGNCLEVSFASPYDEHVPPQQTCKHWFKPFNSEDFDISEKFEGEKLEALLKKTSAQTGKELAKHTLQNKSSYSTNLSLTSQNIHTNKNKFL